MKKILWIVAAVVAFRAIKARAAQVPAGATDGYGVLRYGGSSPARPMSRQLRLPSTALVARGVSAGAAAKPAGGGGMGGGGVPGGGRGRGTFTP